MIKDFKPDGERKEKEMIVNYFKNIKTDKPMREKAIKSLIGILIAIILFYSAGLKIPVLDKKTDIYFKKAITKASIAYATCRVINASISIIKDSELQIEPAGVGVTLAIGEILDPIDDMTERLSDVLVTAISSLGVQKLLYEISISVAPPILAFLLLILSLLLWFKNEKIKRLQKVLIRFSILIIIARFCLPVSSLANEFIYDNFFENQISSAKKELAFGSAELDKLKNFSLPEVDGVMGTIKNSAAFLKKKTIEFKNALIATITKTGNIIENLLKLTFLYIGIFFIQVIFLPLLSFWFFVKIGNSLFNTNIPVIISEKGDNLQKGESNNEK
jgi:hypothetical protein